MIRLAQKKDKEELCNLCIKSYAVKEKPFLEYYFDRQFENSKALVCELDNLLVSQLHEREHVLHLKGKKILVSYLFGIATHYDYRQRKIMRDLLEAMMDDCDKNHLITLLEAGNPKLFERYGFEVISYRKRYVVYAKELIRYTSNGVDENFVIQELVEAYQSFVKVFDCFFERDYDYYKDYVDYIIRSGGHICVYRRKGKVLGYAAYYEQDDGMEVKEIVYQDQRSLCSLLRYVIGFTPFVRIEVSMGEHLEKIFKMSIPRVYPAVMAKINNLKLFNKLYCCNIHNAKELETLCDKPIVLNEKY